MREDLKGVKRASARANELGGGKNL